MYSAVPVAPQRGAGALTSPMAVGSCREGSNLKCCPTMANQTVLHSRDDSFVDRLLTFGFPYFLLPYLPVSFYFSL